MSWGERSCKYINGRCPAQPSMETCNVNCEHYKSNGRRPDSKKRRVTKSRILQAPYAKSVDDRETTNFIEILCRDMPKGIIPGIRAGWNRKYRKEVIACLRK